MSNIYEAVKAEISKQIVGKDEIVQLLLIASLCDGHVLLEGLPGTAKTLIVNSFSKIFNSKFNRIQFTPDLLPSDILGTFIYNNKTSEFELKPGPIFSNFVLADEINRSPPKTQAALLECMAEKQVTITGSTYLLRSPFVVIATQNPIEMEGTYPLPEAQLDRFLFKIIVNYPSRAEEVNMLKIKHDKKAGLNTLFNEASISQLKSTMESVYVDNEIIEYIVSIVEKTRESPDLEWGASPRASVSLLEASKAKAVLEGRNYVIPDDIKFLAYPILRHRLRFQNESETGQTSNDQMVWKILKSIPVPNINQK